MSRYLHDRVVLIPGADQGLGIDLARAVCEAGATAIISGGDEHRLKDAAKALTRDGFQSFFAPLDITDEESVADVFRGVADRFSRLDAVIYNAGASSFGPIGELSLDDWYLQVQFNLTGAFLCLREASRLMRSRREGRVVVLNSMAAREPVSEPAAAYRATRAGLSLLVDGVREELDPIGVRVLQLFLPAEEAMVWDAAEEGSYQSGSTRFRIPALCAQIAQLLDPQAAAITDEIVLRPPFRG